MNTPVVDLVYVINGSVAELVSDLLGIGIGSGLVMVPALLWCFQATGVRGASHQPGHGPGTSLTVICLAGTKVAREHSHIGNLEKPFSRQMATLAATEILGVVASPARQPRQDAPRAGTGCETYRLQPCQESVAASFAWFFRLRSTFRVSSLCGRGIGKGRQRWLTSENGGRSSG